MDLTHLRRAAVTAAVLFFGFAAPARAQFEGEAHDRGQADLERMRERVENPSRAAARFGPQRQHDGFYFRADSGLGYLKMTLPLASETSYSGLATLAGLHVGGTIQDRALLGVQLWAATAQSAKLSPNPAQAGTATVGTLGVGPELTVYFAPSNTYITAAGGVTWLTAKDDTGSDTSKAGVGARIAIGTEWWLAPKWGLGAAVSGTYSANKFDTAVANGSLPFTAWTLGGVLSVTYN